MSHQECYNRQKEDIKETTIFKYNSFIFSLFYKELTIYVSHALHKCTLCDHTNGGVPSYILGHTCSIGLQYE